METTQEAYRPRRPIEQILINANHYACGLNDGVGVRRVTLLWKLKLAATVPNPAGLAAAGARDIADIEPAVGAFRNEVGRIARAHHANRVLRSILATRLLVDRIESQHLDLHAGGCR